MSVRHRLTLLIGALILAVTVLYAASAYQAIRSTVTAEAGDRAARVSGQLAQILSASAGRARTVARSAAETPEFAIYLQGGGFSPDSMMRLLRPAPGRNVEREFHELLDTESRRLVSSAGAPRADPRAVRALVDAIEQHDGPVVGPLLATPSGAFISSLAAIESSSGERLGYLLVWLRADNDTVTRAVLEGLIGTTAVFYLTNRAGDVWTDLAESVTPPSVSPDSALAGPVIYAEAGDAWIGAAAPVQETPWATFVAFPMMEVLAPAEATLRRLTLFGALLLLAALLGTVAIASSMTRPLKTLAGAAQALGEGHYDGPVVEPKAAELAALASAFDAMAARVRDTHDELERRASESRASEARYRETQERLRHVIASTNAVIYERDASTPEGRLTWVSDNIDRVLGWPPEKAVAERWWRRNVHPDDLDALHEWVATPWPGASSRTYRLRHGDGDYRWIRDERRCLTDGDGRVVEVVGAWIDVTAQQTLETQLRQSQKLEAVGRLAGGIAHDFNNVLTVILAEAQSVRTDPDQTRAELVTSLDAVIDAATSASLLTRQLLTFSRRELVAFQTLDLNAVTRSLHSMLRRLIGENLHLDLDLGDGLWPVNADRSHIEQIVANLVVNARDATEQGGSIVLRTENVTLDEEYAAAHAGASAGDFVAVSVSDTGAGMSDEVKAHLFEPFFTTKPLGEGTGLGLATCYTIAQRLGGHIGVYSELGVGTTVRLYLPRTHGVAAVTRAPAEAAEAPGGHETVLMVEDDPSVRMVAARVLRSRGYEVIEADDGAAALDILKNGHPPALLLTDLVMPKMGGRELARQASELHPHLRVLFMSGYTDDVVTRKDLIQRGISFIQKPFTIATLATRVREVLDGNL